MDVSQLFGTRLDFHFLRAEGYRCFGPETGPFVAYTDTLKLVCVCGHSHPTQPGYLQLDRAWDFTMPLFENHISLSFTYLWHGWQARLGSATAMGDNLLEAGMRLSSWRNLANKTQIKNKTFHIGGLGPRFF
ncbi:hypothetical protein [Crenobacter cavernae]|uniref:Uncharacterized protein n=1 Tax=Crenobacter cavernae TaxID=2290923 RepID=A0A345Y3L9_9NEIS|nr:hypothetical protein [Crenobacter cavernae]AXK38521.1 hypothetical protein DWG20_03260 [Crenobacter cavernae]